MPNELHHPLCDCEKCLREDKQHQLRKKLLREMDELVSKYLEELSKLQPTELPYETTKQRIYIKL
jgi:hypothetical protein